MMHISVASKSYRAAPAPVLAGIELSLQPAQFVALLGPSGVGKSTLLNILAGIDSGFVGQRQGWQPRRVGMMFQHSCLMPWLSIVDNLCLVAQRPRQAATRDRARWLLQEVGLGDRLAAFPGELSGGMQRRAALARALMPEPELLLLDEPTASLDQECAARVRQLLLKLWNTQRCAVVCVTHRLEEAVALADRVLMLAPAPGGTGPACLLKDENLGLPRPRTPAAVAAETLRLQQCWGMAQ